MRRMDGSGHRGVARAIDPETGSIVLLKCSTSALSSPEVGETVYPILISGHALESIQRHCGAARAEGAANGSPAAQAARPQVLLPVRLESTVEILDDALCARRCEAICTLLERQCVPFTIEHAADGGAHIVVLGCLRAWPPYSEHTCRCENEMVLNRFQQLLDILDGS